jgi:glutamyl-Q tRNA(Asp) synthetase
MSARRSKAGVRHATGAGRFLLRLEDIDATRCRPEYAAAILEDLAWLGIDWVGRCGVNPSIWTITARPSLGSKPRGCCIPASAPGRDIQAEIARAGGAPQGENDGEAGPLYPGACRRLDPAVRAAKRESGVDYALRLDVGAARARAGPLTWDRPRV